MFGYLTKLRLAAWALGIALGVGVLSTAPAQARDYYGAIAFSQRTGAHGYAYDYGSRAEAQRNALIECARYGGGCRVAAWFKNGCGALAVGNRNGWGAEWAPNRRRAEQLALQRCAANTSNCWVEVWACTTR